jgi:hypothetical protein
MRQQPEWRSSAELQRHFSLHGSKLRVNNLHDYDASARETIDIGTRFNYRDRFTGEWRAGYYGAETRRFTALTHDETEILTHYPCSERYVRDNLWASDYT